MIRVAVCDDDKLVLESLTKRIKTFFSERNQKLYISTYSDSKIFLKKFREEKLDLVFLDIDMPEITGFEIAKTIRFEQQKLSIIFVTGYDDMVYQSLKYRIFRFLRKSRLEEELEEALSDWINEYGNYRRQRVFETKEGMLSVNIKEIKYIDVHGHEIMVYMSDNTYFVLKSRTESLSSLENELFEYGFIRIHKGCLVNYRYIKILEKTEAILDNSENLPISRNRYKKVLSDYHMFIRSENECG